MRKFIYILLLLSAPCVASAGGVVTGAERMDVYLPVIGNGRVGIVTNHTGIVGGRHLVDTLLALGVRVEKVFAPEHGFRGDADAGEKVSGYRDRATGVKVVSIYGSARKPPAGELEGLDAVLFDIQDVGLRYYTYLSSMHLVMEACAGADVPVIVLDRPNPNGFYVDGPVMEERYRSFVGMHPIPVVHGMTLGELALMINGEGWLAGGVKCRLTVVECLGYTRGTRYSLPVPPSPNLPNMRAVYLYPSLCCMEGTAVSVGRGTPYPFQVYGHPALKGAYEFEFTPVPSAGAKNPPLKGQPCFGEDLRTQPSDERIIAAGIDLGYVIGCYRAMPDKSNFFNPMFEKLMGVGYIREMIIAGSGAQEIKERWKRDVGDFLIRRRPYLLYEE